MTTFARPSRYVLGVLVIVFAMVAGYAQPATAATDYYAPPQLNSLTRTSPSPIYSGEYLRFDWAVSPNTTEGYLAFNGPLGQKFIHFPNDRGATELITDNWVPGDYTPAYAAAFTAYGNAVYYPDGRTSTNGLRNPEPANVDWNSLSFRVNELQNFEYTGDLSVSGTMTVGQTLTANIPVLEPTPTNIEYRWIHDGCCFDMSTSEPTYVLRPQDTGKKFVVRAYATKHGYRTYQGVTEPTAPVMGVITSSARPTITGTAIVGQALSANLGTLDPTPETASYQWKRNGEVIPDASASKLTLTDADSGKEISVTVTAHKAGYEPLVESSAPTAPTLNRFSYAPLPTITGTTRSGQVLTAQSGSWEPLPEAVSYTWYRNGVIIPAATAPSYTLGADDEGTSLTVRVTAEKTGYATTSSSSSATSKIAPPLTFSDVTGTTGFYNEISWLAGREISTGWVEEDGSRTYRPHDAIARAAMAAFLYRMAGKPDFEPPAVSPFADVDQSTGFYKEITWLAAKGISTGWTEHDGSKTFRPHDSIERNAMAAFLYRYAGNPNFEAPANSPFIDVPVGGGFYQHITWLASQGISTGWDAGYGCRAFNPYQPVARAAMAAFMYRSVNGGTGAVDGSGCNPPRP